MDEGEFKNMDESPGRWLAGIAGAGCFEAGVQAMLTSQSTSLIYIAPLTILGVILLLLAAFWKKLKFNQTGLAQKLNNIGADPRVWISLVAVVWIFTSVSNIVKEISRNNEIITLRNDEQSIAKVIDRVVLPRRVTKSQQRVISNFLSNFEPHEYSFRLPNRYEEAGSFRADIEAALIKSGWKRSAIPYVYADDVQEGLSISLQQTAEHAQKTEDPKNPNAAVVLGMAFGLAGVRMTGGPGTSGGGNITQDQLVISIGYPRKDSYALTSPDD